MQMVARSLGRVGRDLPRMCRWRRWPTALARREAPQPMPLTPAQPDPNRLGSFYKPWRLIPFACGSTKCMDTENLRTAVIKDSIDHNPTVNALNVAVSQVDSKPHHGAMCNNKILQENSSDSNLDDCYDSGMCVTRPPASTSHRDGAIYNKKFMLENCLDYDINDRNETRLEPMMFSGPHDVHNGPQFILQFFSLLLSRSPISNGSIQLYGYIAARDDRDGMLNYIVNYSRDNAIVVQQGSLIEMTGPKRGILVLGEVLIEFDMRIKMGEHEDDDPQLIDGALICTEHVYLPWLPLKERIIGSSGAIDMALAVVGYAVEATIEVVISEVQSGLSLSLSSFVDVGDDPQEIQLFNGLIAQPEALRRFVVAVQATSALLLKFTFDNEDTREIKFGSRVRGCASNQIRLKGATISVKVTWSTI